MSVAGRVEMAAILIKGGLITTSVEYLAVVNLGSLELTVDQWLSLKCEIAPEDIEKYENAKKAAKIKNSKLYKAMK